MIDSFSVARDLPQAIRLLSRNCTQEAYAPSCSLLGEMLLTPSEGEMEKAVGGRDPRKAVEYLERACEGQDGKSCYNLAVLYKLGDKGVPPDMGKFREFATKANEIIKTERKKMEQT